VPPRFSIAQDRKLIQIVDRALEEVTRKSGAHLVCRLGCTPCCIGVFAINQLDADRLRRGLQELEKKDPERAAAIRQRSEDSVRRLTPDFPGDPVTGVLHETAMAKELFEDFANDEACPVLDPDTGTCDLYKSRPMTCRVFGPPVRSPGGLGVCELCYHGATDEEIAACELIPDPDGVEDALLAALEKKTGRSGDTIIAFCLAE